MSDVSDEVRHERRGGSDCGDLTAAFDRTVAACELTDVDAAAAEAGRTIARQIDYAVGSLEGQDVTKALYLTPHLMNVLKELLATPASRAAVKDTARSSVVRPVKDEVAEKRAGRGWRSA